jgi:hypothetical protein
LGTTNDGEFAWTIPLDMALGTYYLRVVDSNDYDTYPEDGESYMIGTYHVLYWESFGNSEHIIQIDLYQGTTYICQVGQGRDP